LQVTEVFCRWNVGTEVAFGFEVAFFVVFNVAESKAEANLSATVSTEYRNVLLVDYGDLQSFN